MSKAKAEQVQGLVAKLQKTQRAASGMPKLVVHNHLPRPSGPRRPKGSGPIFGRPCVNQVSRGAGDLRNKGLPCKGGWASRGDDRFFLERASCKCLERSSGRVVSSCLPQQQDHAQAHFRFLAAGCCHKCSAAAFGAAHKISCELVSAGAAKLLSFCQGRPTGRPKMACVSV